MKRPATIMASIAIIAALDAESAEMLVKIKELP
jgi:hypothetical protein